MNECESKIASGHKVWFCPKAIYNKKDKLVNNL